MKKSNAMLVLLFLTFICFNEKIVAETTGEPFDFDEKIELNGDFLGDYIFSCWCNL
jgi:hypothetical protein